MNLPIYVTRPHDGYTGAFCLSPRLFLITCLLIWLNVIGWSAYGLYALINVLVQHA